MNEGTLTEKSIANSTETKEAIANLEVQEAFKLIEFYENVANTVKGRTWTITAWILSINSVLLAFSFQLYTGHSELYGFLGIQAAICGVGIILCLFLCIFIQDQGKHLSHYWTNEKRVGAWNSGVQDLVFKDDIKPVEFKMQEALKSDYEADFPKFCYRLISLSIMFAVGFVGTFLLMIMLVANKLEN